MGYKRGSVYLANLNPSKKSEPGKVRPVLVLQTDLLNDAGHPSTLVMPLTTNLIDNMRLLRIRVPKRGKLEQDSDLLIDQVRAIDNERFTSGVLAELSGEEMEKVLELVCKLVGR